MITHILLNLPEKYQTVVEILEDKIDYKDVTLAGKSIRDNLSVKFD